MQITAITITGIIVSIAALCVSAAISHIRTNRMIDNILDCISRMNLVFCERAEAMHERIIKLEKAVDEFPVNDMRAAAKKEALFFEGLQNIIEYGPDSVQSLNKEAVHIE